MFICTVLGRHWVNIRKFKVVMSARRDKSKRRQGTQYISNFVVNMGSIVKVCSETGVYIPVCVFRRSFSESWKSLHVAVAKCFEQEHFAQSNNILPGTCNLLESVLWHLFSVFSCIYIHVCDLWLEYVFNFPWLFLVWNALYFNCESSGYCYSNNNLTLIPVVLIYFCESKAYIISLYLISWYIHCTM